MGSAQSTLLVAPVRTIRRAEPISAAPVHGVDDGDVAPLEVLLARVADGSHEAFADLYRRVASPVMWLVIRRVRDRAHSEEVTQEVFMEIWECADRFDASLGNALSWIMRIAHGRAVDRIRTAQKDRERDLRIGIRDQEIVFDSVLEAAETRIENERARRAMGSLTELQREAVALAYFGGRSHDDIARHMRIPVRTFKTRLRDGLLRLRKELAVA